MSSPLLFAGQYADEESGWVYNRFRFYDPAAGVYGSQDPLGVSPNLGTAQGYVGNAVVENDPYGLKAHGKPSGLPEPLGRGSSAKFDTVHPNAIKQGDSWTQPATLEQQMLMKEARSNPFGGVAAESRGGLTDPRWPASEGWEKAASKNTANNVAQVHWVRNTQTGAVDDFKYKATQSAVSWKLGK